MYLIRSELSFDFFWTWFTTSSELYPGCQSSNLLNGGIIYSVVLIQVFSVAPHVSFQQVNTLHLQEYPDGVGHCFHVGRRYLDRSEPGASLHQVEEVNVRCSEGHMDHFFVGIEIGNLSLLTDYSKFHILWNNYIPLYIYRRFR